MTQIKKMVIIFSAMAIILLLAYFVDEKISSIKEEKILDNLKVVSVLITNTRTNTYKPPLHSINYQIFYASNAKVKIIDKSNGYDYASLQKDSLPNLVGRYLLAVVDSTNPEKYHQLLLTEANFKTYGIAIPDSLMYLKTYERR